jgi:hypothetical protein
VLQCTKSSRNRPWPTEDYEPLVNASVYKSVTLACTCRGCQPPQVAWRFKRELELRWPKGLQRSSFLSVVTHLRYSRGDVFARVSELRLERFANLFASRRSSDFPGSLQNKDSSLIHRMCGNLCGKMAMLSSNLLTP